MNRMFFISFSLLHPQPPLPLPFNFTLSLPPLPQPHPPSLPFSLINTCLGRAKACHYHMHINHRHVHVTDHTCTAVHVHVQDACTHVHSHSKHWVKYCTQYHTDLSVQLPSLLPYLQSLFVLIIEFIFCVSQHDRCLAHGALPQENHLGLHGVVAPFRIARRRHDPSLRNTAPHEQLLHLLALVRDSLLLLSQV